MKLAVNNFAILVKKNKINQENEFKQRTSFGQNKEDNFDPSKKEPQTIRTHS